VEAGRTFEDTAAEARARRLDEAFWRELRVAYHDTGGAERAFVQLVAERTAAQAAHSVSVRERPDVLGPLRTADALDHAAFARLPAAGLDAAEARAVARATGGRSVTASPASPELTATRAAVEQALGRERQSREALRRLPGAAELERRIGQGVAALTPRAFRQLQLAVTAPQLLVAQRLRAAMRDAVLGRDDDASLR